MEGNTISSNKGYTQPILTRSAEAPQAESYSIRYKEESKDIIRYDVEMNGENGYMRVFDLFLGVKFSINDFNMQKMPFDATASKEGLIINCCLGGRCQVDVGSNNQLFIQTNNVCVDVKHAQGFFISPTKCYQGVSIYLDFPTLAQHYPRFFVDLEIDIIALRERFCRQGASYIGELDNDVCSFIRHTVANPQFGIAECRLLLAYCLKTVAWLDPDANICNQVFLTPSKSRIAQAVECEMSENLGNRLTIDAMARKYGVSESSLRIFFKSVFGESITDYMRHLRMDRAKELLGTPGNSIGFVALKVGYSSQSKFAAVFKAYCGLSPLEYRRQARSEAYVSEAGSLTTMLANK
jgi:AraC-like DNA-binding protein